MPNLKIKLYHRHVCTGKRHSVVYRVAYYWQFQASTVGERFLKVSPENKGDYCNKTDFLQSLGATNVTAYQVKEVT